MTIEMKAPKEGRAAEVLTDEALSFLAELHRHFEPVRRELLSARAERQRSIDGGTMPDFLEETTGIRSDHWRVSPAPADLSDRRVEITGPTDRKMIINALNSGAKVFMADFEDANSPTWHNMVDGQVNLVDAVRRRISHQEEGKQYRLKAEVAVLFVRPRGWHLDETHLLIDDQPISGSIFDFALYLFHNGKELLERGTGPYFYLPKLESHREARLWNDLFVFSQERLGIPVGSIKATVLIETILAAFEMDEILYELRQHSAGLNAGRWDYIFSIIKKFRSNPELLLPDRSQVSMTVPFMRAYTELLVKTCHRRGAHAMGGMAAFVPSRRNPEINEKALSAVRRDKQRESNDGFDGTWVAHPDLVEVATAEFDRVLGERTNQVDRQRPEVEVTGEQLLDIRVPDGQVSEAGLRSNVSIGLLYIDSWLRGNGAAALYNLMEDTATAEISRSQIWQWARHRAAISEGTRVTAKWVERVIDEELEKIRQFYGNEHQKMRLDESAALFREVALGEEFVEFLTIPGMHYLDPA